MKNAFQTILIALVIITNLIWAMILDDELTASTTTAATTETRHLATVAGYQGHIADLNLEITARENENDQLFNTLSSCAAERNQAISLLRDSLRNSRETRPIFPVPGTNHNNLAEK